MKRPSREGIRMLIVFMAIAVVTFLEGWARLP